MKFSFNLFSFGLALLMMVGLSLSGGCYYDVEETLYPAPPGGSDCDTIDVSYSSTVFPILEENCVSCHQGTSPGGNVSLEAYSDIVLAAESGNLYGSIAHLDGFSKMPKGGEQLPTCEIDQIKSWVDAGSPNN